MGLTLFDKRLKAREEYHEIKLVQHSVTGNLRDLSFVSGFPPKPTTNTCPSWKFLEELKELTTNIDYGCDKCHRDDEKRCCDRCADTIGFTAIMSIEMYNLYKAAYDNKTGFWRKNIGCILPRRYRSPTCLTHKCNFEAKYNWEETLLQLLTYLKADRLVSERRHYSSYLYTFLTLYASYYREKQPIIKLLEAVGGKTNIMETMRMSIVVIEETRKTPQEIYGS